MKKYNYINLLTGFCLLALLSWFTGCSEEEPYESIAKRQKVSVSMTLNVPGMNAAGTRAMSTSDEAAIDPQKIQVLVFEVNGTSEVFRYQATITNRALPKLTLEVPTSSSGEKYRFVVLANTESQTITEGKSKEEALAQFTFDCLGKWNASSSNPAKIPMWGEADPIEITGDAPVNILMHRALARVDVGLLFKFNNNDPATNAPPSTTEPVDRESVYGLDNFKLKDIRVYRTRTQAYVASSAENMTGNEVTTPLIPSAALYNTAAGTGVSSLGDADADPLLYTLPVPNNSYIREIYIPESALIDAQSNMDNVPCLVIGGYYGAGNTTDVTYYRADFADYNRGAVTAYRPILRNHRHIFDIRKVSGPGYETPEQALKSIPANMDLTVVDWNQVALGFYVQGHYYLSVQERDVVMEARPQGDATENRYVVPFQTNLLLDGSTGKRFEYTWTSSNSTASAHFDVMFDYVNKQIILTANNNNVDLGEGERTDVLTLRVENFELNIRIKQKAFDLDYTLDCGSVEVHGRYREDVPLNYSNYISMKVTSNTNLNGSAYEVKTLEKNGIYFLAEGTFANPTTSGVNYVYDLKLEGHGTPVNEAGGKVFMPFNVTIVSNSINNTSCNEARIVVGYKTKRILTIGANAIYRYGYMLEPNTAARAFVDASINFGTDPNSTVTMEENQYGNAFTIEVMTAGKGMIGEVIDYNYLKDKLNTFKPDIILTGQAINYFTSGNNTNVINLLSDFVDAGGVFLMCNEYYPYSPSIDAMVGKIMGGSPTGKIEAIGNNQLFALTGDVNDPIVNGPFGNMNGYNWGADGHILQSYRTSDLPSGTKIYSTLMSEGESRAIMFRHPTKPFFFMGEGGFISNPQRYIGGAYQGNYAYCPFAIDAAYRPIPRTNFTMTKDAPVYNSQIFANILTWAVEYSETQGIDYPETENKFP